MKVLNAYELKDEKAVHVTRGLRSMLHGFALLEQKGEFGLSLNIDESLYISLNIFIKGLHKVNEK